MSEEQKRISWDAERAGAPKRPEFASGLPEEELIDRPRRVVVAVALALVAAAVLLFGVVTAAMGFAELRDGLVEALPDDLREDYEAEDQELAASVMLIVTGALAVLLALLQLLAVRALAGRRSGAARIAFTVFVVLSVPVTLLAFILREGGALEAALTGVALVALVLAVLLVCTPRVSQWLRQSEPHRTIPIAEPGTAG